MGVYLFIVNWLDKILWGIAMNPESSHDFGKDIIPRLITSDARVLLFLIRAMDGRWHGQSYWQAHMDMLSPAPNSKLYNRDWIIHTRTETTHGAFASCRARICEHDL